MNKFNLGIAEQKAMLDKIVDTLADKELKFGCILLDDFGVGFPFCDCIRFVDKKDGTISFCDSGENFKILGSPIYIGDVLQKIADEDRVICLGWGAEASIITIWHPLGLSKSLQEIFSNAFEEYTLCGECGEEECGCVTQKWTEHKELNPSVAKLAEFLIDTFDIK